MKNKKSIGVIGAIIIGIIGIFLRYQRFESRQSARESQRQQVSIAQSVNQAIQSMQTQSGNKDARERLKEYAQNKGTESSSSTLIDTKETPAYAYQTIISEQFVLGLRQGTYYIFDKASGNENKLPKVTTVYVLTLINKNKNSKSKVAVGLLEDSQKWVAFSNLTSAQIEVQGDTSSLKSTSILMLDNGKLTVYE